jgi:membrane protease YdiL (CAAX protease family)
MDKQGDIALGMSASSDHLDPSVWYTGRVPSDPLGKMEAPTIVVKGTAVQVGGAKTFLPQRTLEILLWIGVSISAGFCEELVFRGYFQKQFETLTHSRWIALFLQAVLFGVSHGYQGIEACVKIACFGTLFGLLAVWRGSLRPGMTAHAWSDVLSGIFGI